MRAITASAFNDDVGKTVWATPGTGDLKPEVPQTQAHIVGVLRSSAAPHHAPLS
jgi:hypothetical protein